MRIRTRIKMTEKNKNEDTKKMQKKKRKGYNEL